MLFNIINVLYFIIRLAPFIVVAYFTLQCFFVQDLTSGVYLMGVVLASLLAIQLGNYPTFKPPGDNKLKETPPWCKIIQLTENGPMSRLPLGQTVLGYTLFFAIYIIVKNGLVKDNIGFIVIMSFLVAADMMWNTLFSCADIGSLIIALIVGGTFGVIWALLFQINQKQTNVDLSRFNNFNTHVSPTCTLTGSGTNKTYTCKSYN